MDIPQKTGEDCKARFDDETLLQLMTTRWRIENEFQRNYVYNLPEFYSLIEQLERSTNNLSMTTFRRLVKHLNASYRLRFKLEKDLMQWDPFRADVALAFLASESRRLSTMAHYLVTRVNGYTENLYEETYNNEELEKDSPRSL
ncbi:DgyrCDS10430 [Dimorphilus gyrociliatus]|uniref:DgyrCDS10430 n=1 Tax=Dimorphilus gyrociliatus TaxID=2664684 RepID=A0A7I8W268_9ANNE|nr:DgyrCDS10430 [Dimorphilus gyrociliatus]